MDIHNIDVGQLYTTSLALLGVGVTGEGVIRLLTVDDPMVRIGGGVFLFVGLMLMYRFGTMTVKGERPDVEDMAGNAGWLWFVIIGGVAFFAFFILQMVRLLL